MIPIFLCPLASFTKNIWGVYTRGTFLHVRACSELWLYLQKTAEEGRKLRLCKSIITRVSQTKKKTQTFKPASSPWHQSTITHLTVILHWVPQYFINPCLQRSPSYSQPREQNECFTAATDSPFWEFSKIWLGKAWAAWPYWACFVQNWPSMSHISCMILWLWLTASTWHLSSCTMRMSKHTFSFFWRHIGCS